MRPGRREPYAPQIVGNTLPLGRTYSSCQVFIKIKALYIRYLYIADGSPISVYFVAAAARPRFPTTENTEAGVSCLECTAIPFSKQRFIDGRLSKTSTRS